MPKNHAVSHCIKVISENLCLSQGSLVRVGNITWLRNKLNFFLFLLHLVQLQDKYLGVEGEADIDVSPLCIHFLHIKWKKTKEFLASSIAVRIKQVNLVSCLACSRWSLSVDLRIACCDIYYSLHVMKMVREGRKE
jgi:hypothetical protein